MAADRYGKVYGIALKKVAKWHRRRGSVRSGAPHLSHLLAVSALVWEDGGTEAEAIAGLLHDSVATERTTLADVREMFGAEVARIVARCGDAAVGPDDADQPWFERGVARITELHAIGAARDVPTMRVVGADALAGLRALLADDRGRPTDPWDRFVPGLGGFAWYHEAIIGAVECGLPGSMLGRELRAAYAPIEAVVARATGGLGELPDRIGPLLGDIAVSGRCDATPHLSFELARVASKDAGDPEAACGAVLLGWFGPPADAGRCASQPDRIRSTRWAPRVGQVVASTGGEA